MTTSIPTPPAAPNDESLDIAIIGMAGRFPGAKNIDEYWANLLAGKESIRQLSEEELLQAGVSRREFEHPDYVRVCPVLDDIDQFDAAFFGMSPRDASVMDPAHRFFLEVAHQALEHSGNTGLPEEGRVAVFAGSGAPLYWMNNVRTHREIMESMGEFLVRHTGNDMNFLATRASYDLDLRGPSVNVQTACSSALVAAHMARQSLLAGECDMALIGGSTVVVPMAQGYHYKEGEILSPDGHCRPFDHKSAGTVFGSGTGCLVLKRLSDALDHGDTVHAIIRGSAVTNDGSVKVGYLAPGVDGQAIAIQDALKAARAEARSISYVEAHGTGTSVGDPIELTALEQAYRAETQDNQFCGVGSVKSNIGHLGEAAAAASLIKVVLALKHKILPKSLGFEKPNPRFPLEESPFYIAAETKAWTQPSGPLRAGITALGAGGTNCHLILEEPPAPLEGEGGRSRQLLLLSAKSKKSLDAMTENLAAHLEAHPTADLNDVAYTLTTGRRSFSHRRVVVAESTRAAAKELREKNPARLFTLAADPDDPEIVFTFPGGGAQYARMCHDLYFEEEIYRQALDECLAIIDSEIDGEIRGILFAEPAEVQEKTRRLESPALALPTLFAVEYSLAKLFESYGVYPKAFIGHSMGEYVAACLAGVFSVRDGLRLVHKRGKLFETVERGKMVGISLSEAEARKLMPAELSIAAVNAPDLCVASGKAEAIDALSELLKEKEVDFTPIRIDVAAHSSLLDPILDEFRTFCQTIQFQPPTRPIASNLTGTWLTAAEATDPNYWVNHLRGTVRFADCVETVLEGGSKVFLEIGPGRTLTTLVGAQKTKVKGAVNSVRHPKEEANDLQIALGTVGKIWAAGADVDWTAFFDGELRNRVPLPVYAFDTQSYWVAPKLSANQDATEPVKRDDMNEWFQTLAWEPAPLVAARAPKAPETGADGAVVQAPNWLLIGESSGDLHALSTAIQAQTEGAVITVATPGGRLRKVSEAEYEIPPGGASGYQSLLELLIGAERAPTQIVLLKAPLSPPSQDGPKGGFFKKPITTPPPATPQAELARHYFDPAHLAQAIMSTLETGELTLVTSRAYSVGGEALNPFARLALGPAQVLPREMPEVCCRVIDVAAPGAQSERALTTLARELAFGTNTESPTALRGHRRFQQRLRPVSLPEADASADEQLSITDGDHVLITGGLGGMGLVLARHLTRRAKVALSLLSREGLPPREEWNALLKTAPNAAVARRITQVLALEAAGAQVCVVAGNVTDGDSLSQALESARQNLGPITVVIHAAGIMADEPLATKSDEKMQKVLGPKVLGTLQLDRLVTEDLKAFVVMSSVASLLGLPGQADYTAANAFLDAFVEDRTERTGQRTLAINWNAWRDVGMVVNEQKPSLGPLPTEVTSHPFLASTAAEGGDQLYFTDFQVKGQWLLEEHQIAGADALIPGTGFVEIARAAAADTLTRRGQKATALELSQVTFLSPFQVGAEETRRMQVRVSPSGADLSVTLTTAETGEVHMTAEVRAAPSLDRATVSFEPAALRARLKKTQKTKGAFLDQDFVNFGPRWGNIESIALGDREALISLRLADAFAADLTELAYHPAVMDMATGAAQALIPGFNQQTDFYVPFGYDRLTLLAPLTARSFSHVTIKKESTTGVASFDVTVASEAGVPLIVIEGFTMKKVAKDAGIARSARSQAPAVSPEMEALLREAITPAEGVEAFDRALSQDQLSQVIISSVDVNVWLKKLAQGAKAQVGGGDDSDGPSFARPALDSDYVSPSGQIETVLAGVWSKLLGVGQVGVIDDFFELGGNSLVAVRMFARLKKEFSVNLPLSTLFQSPTIRALAADIRAAGFVETDSSPAPADPSAATEVSANAASGPARPLLIRKGSDALPALFLVHDGLGEVLLYRTLALGLAKGHSVYGLEPEAKDGRFLHTTIQKMASAKVERMRAVQPHGPYLIAGLCAGGVIAFEIARQLEDQGERTLFVGLIDAASAGAEEKKGLATKGRVGRLWDTVKPPKDTSLASHLVTAVPTLAKKSVNFVKYETNSRLERSQNEKKVHALNEAADGADAPTIDFLKLYELAHTAHVPTGHFQSGEVVLFRATEGDGTLEDQPFREIYADELLGWQPHVATPITARDIPGGHASCLQEPHVKELAKGVQAALDRALALDNREAKSSSAHANSQTSSV